MEPRDGDSPGGRPAHSRSTPPSQKCNGALTLISTRTREVSAPRVSLLTTRARGRRRRAPAKAREARPQRRLFLRRALLSGLARLLLTSEPAAPPPTRRPPPVGIGRRCRRPAISDARARRTTSERCGEPSGASIRGSTACSSTVKSSPSSRPRSSAPTQSAGSTPPGLRMPAVLVVEVVVDDEQQPTRAHRVEQSPHAGLSGDFGGAPDTASTRGRTNAPGTVSRGRPRRSTRRLAPPRRSAARSGRTGRVCRATVSDEGSTSTQALRGAAFQGDWLGASGHSVPPNSA